MRFFTVAFTLFVTAASAFAVSLIAREDYPQCSLPCISNAPLGNCTLFDTLCLCNSKQFVENTTACIKSSCSEGDFNAAGSLALENCKKVGVSLTSTSSASQPSSSVKGSSTSSGASQNNHYAFLILGAAAFAAFSLYF